jgi:RimJ/RimL family protein N-acetyltransferase
MQIRNATRSDLVRVHNIYDQGYTEAEENPNFGDYLRLTKPGAKRKNKWTKEIYSDIKKGNVIFFVAEENNALVGFCYVKKRDIPDSEISHVGILGIRILKEFRRHGIGSKLVSRALKESKHKFEIIEVYIMSINKASKAIFTKFGFRTWGIAPGFVKRGNRYIDLEYMYLKL